MGVIENVLMEKRAERRTLMAKAEVLAKQISDLEAAQSLIDATAAPKTQKAATSTKQTTKARKTTKK